MITKNFIHDALRILFCEAPHTFYIGLSNTPPTITGENISEPDIGMYRRVQLSPFVFSSDEKVSNSMPIQFPTSTFPWFDAEQPAAYWVIFDGEDSAAKCVASGRFSVPFAVESDTTVIIPERSVVIDGTDSTL